MNYNQTNGIAEDATIRHLLGPVEEMMQEGGATEVVINEPGFGFIESNGQWQERTLPEMTFEKCFSLGIAIAQYTNQLLSPEQPIMSASLPRGERIQVVIPPACERNTVSITIRIPSSATKSMEDYENDGMFSDIITAKRTLSAQDMELKGLLETKNYRAFFEKAILSKKNIAIVGDTGSGKTTFMKTICQLIPTDERIITIEDVRELFLLKHRNRVHLTYSSQGGGLSKIDPATLVKSTMRMKPDRVLPAELRGAEAFDFVDLLTTGHAGSITSFHAENCGVAFERFALMCKKHENANTYTHSELLRLLHMTVDVIAHVERRGSTRRFSEIYFDPEKKLGFREGH
jgi:type IV secretion system protein VirB11